MSIFTSNSQNYVELCGIGDIFNYLKPFFNFFQHPSILASKGCWLWPGFSTTWTNLDEKTVLHKSCKIMSSFTSNIQNNAHLCAFWVIWEFVKVVFPFLNLFLRYFSLQHFHRNFQQCYLLLNHRQVSIFLVSRTPFQWFFISIKLI